MHGCLHDYVIYPRPQWRRVEEGFLRLPACPVIAIRNERLSSVAGSLQDWLQQEHHLQAGIVASGQKADIVLGTLDEPELRARCTSSGWLTDDRVLRHEGYVLHVDDEGITMAGGGLAGVFYGVQSLQQLLQSGPDGISAPQITVQDWPYKPLRGIHMYLPARHNIPFLKKLMPLLAALKYNTLFLEVGGGMRYDSHPEVNAGWEAFSAAVAAFPGGPYAFQQSSPFPKDSCHTELAGGSFLEKEEVRELVAWARQWRVEVIPELQSLSHAYYLLSAHRDLAERTDDPWPDTYCPSNPGSCALYFDLLEEVIEVFQPRIIHIGHDEAYIFGACPRCLGKSAARLLADDINKIHDFLAARGIRTAMWGDKLLNVIIGGRDEGGRAIRWVDPRYHLDYTMAETYHAVDMVPKDLLILDWSWSLDPASERYFGDRGFETIYGNFGNYFEPQTFWQWDKRSQGAHILGGEIPTWCDVSEWAFGHNGIFAHLLISANMLWWANYHDRERERTLQAVSAIQPHVRDNLAGRISPSLAKKGKRFTPLSLEATFNASPDFAEGLPKGEQYLRQIPFLLSDPAEGRCAIVVDRDHPLSASIPVGHSADSLVFLHCARSDVPYRTTWHMPDPIHPSAQDTLGCYEITYTDGSMAVVELRYGENITRPDVRYGEDIVAVPYWADFAWEGRDYAGRPVTLYTCEWINPHPEKPIRDVAIHYTAEENQGQLFLFAVTGVNIDSGSFSREDD